jgi:integrase
VPCHHNLATYLDAWINAAGIAAEKKEPLFRAVRKGNKLTENPMAREDVFAMIKRRAKAAALPYSTCCHTFRATGITTYMQNGGTLEHAQQSLRTSRHAPPSCTIARRTRFRSMRSSASESEIASRTFSHSGMFVR